MQFVWHSAIAHIMLGVNPDVSVINDDDEDSKLMFLNITEMASFQEYVANMHKIWLQLEMSKILQAKRIVTVFKGKPFAEDKLIEAIKDLVQEASLDCSESSMSLQAIDTSHVSLVSLLMRCEGFETYIRDRNINIGRIIASSFKMLKRSASNNVTTLKAGDNLTVSYSIVVNDLVSRAHFQIKAILNQKMVTPEIAVFGVPPPFIPKWRKIDLKMESRGTVMVSKPTIYQYFSKN